MLLLSYKNRNILLACLNFIQLFSMLLLSPKNH